MSLAIPQDLNLDPPKPPERRRAYCPLCALPLRGLNLTAPMISFGQRTRQASLFGCHHAKMVNDNSTSIEAEELIDVWNNWALETFATLADARKYSPAQRAAAAITLKLHDE